MNDDEHADLVLGDILSGEPAGQSKPELIAALTTAATRLAAAEIAACRRSVAAYPPHALKRAQGQWTDQEIWRDCASNDVQIVVEAIRELIRREPRSSSPAHQPQQLEFGIRDKAATQ